MSVAHIAVYFRAGSHCRNGVKYDYINSAGTHQRFDDLKRLLAGIRLGYQHIVDIDAELLCIYGVEGVLNINERSSAARFLRLCDSLQRNGGLTGGFGAVYLDYSSLGKSAYAEGEVKHQRACGDVLDVKVPVFAHEHYRARAVGLFYLRHGGL